MNGKKLFVIVGLGASIVAFAYPDAPTNHAASPSTRVASNAVEGTSLALPTTTVTQNATEDAGSTKAPSVVSFAAPEFVAQQSSELQYLRDENAKLTAKVKQLDHDLVQRDAMLSDLQRQIAELIEPGRRLVDPHRRLIELAPAQVASQASPKAQQVYYDPRRQQSYGYGSCGPGGCGASGRGFGSGGFRPFGGLLRRR